MTAPARRSSGAHPLPAPGTLVLDADRREEMRSRILRVALELFAREGFENTTVRMIARHCGVSDAALYYYFRSKRAILGALWDIPQSRMLARADPATPLTVARLMELVDEMISASADVDALIRVMIRQALSGDESAAAFRQRTMDAWRHDVRGHFQTALPDGDAALNADLLTALVFGVTFRAQSLEGANYAALAHTDAFHDRVKAILLAGLPFCRERSTR